MLGLIFSVIGSLIIAYFVIMLVLAFIINVGPWLVGAGIVGFICLGLYSLMQIALISSSVELAAGAFTALVWLFLGGLLVVAVWPTAD